MNSHAVAQQHEGLQATVVRRGASEGRGRVRISRGVVSGHFECRCHGVSGDTYGRHGVTCWGVNLFPIIVFSGESAVNVRFYLSFNSCPNHPDAKASESLLKYSHTALARGARLAPFGEEKCGWNNLLKWTHRSLLLRGAIFAFLGRRTSDSLEN